jgi:hypothetical protein
LGLSIWWRGGLGAGGSMRPAYQRARWEVLRASCWDYFIHAGCKWHITPQGAGVATGPVKFVVEALRRLVWTWTQVAGRLDRLHIRVHLWWGSRWSRRLLVVTGAARCPLTNKARGCCCRTTGDHRAPLRPGRAARRYLRTSRCIASRPPGVRGRAGAGAAGASYASCRSGSIYWGRSTSVDL